MPDPSLEYLRERSQGLAAGGDMSDAAVEAHRALVEADPTSMAGRNRLGIALLNRAQLDEAEAVFAAALAADADNEVAARRLDEIHRSRRANAVTARPGVGREEWPEYVEHDPDEIRRLYESGTDNWKAGLRVLADAAPSRLTYEQIEDALRWPRGRWKNVIGGSRSADGEATRPYHICSPALSRTGEWEAWMDEAQAQAVLNR